MLARITQIARIRIERIRPRPAFRREHFQKRFDQS
jgi:hypothetical protein